MPWEKQYNKVDVLDRAMEAFWARGYEATSMSDLVAATGINRGSIYEAFSCKHGLFIEALLHYDNNYRANVLKELGERYAPKKAIAALFEGSINLHRSDDGLTPPASRSAALKSSAAKSTASKSQAAKTKRAAKNGKTATGAAKPSGCFMVNTAIELSPYDPEVDAIVSKNMREIEDFFKAQIKKGRADGSIGGRGTPTELARALLNSLMGLQVICRGRPEKALVRSISKQTMALLD